MHPPLDRPHPDCQEAIENLKSCHAGNPLGRLVWGSCNEFKRQLDNCFKNEKARLLTDKLDERYASDKVLEQDMILEGFGKKETFAEYLAKDKDYLREVQKKQAAKSNARA